MNVTNPLMINVVSLLPHGEFSNDFMK